MTSVWIDYVRGVESLQTDLLDYELLHERVGTGDVIIGSFCIEHGFELLHSDHDFDPMEAHLGLRVKRS